MKTLSDLFPNLRDLFGNAGDSIVSSIVCDSREAIPGSLFAVFCKDLDREITLVQNATINGAKFILREKGTRQHAEVFGTNGITFITVPNIRIELARICAEFETHNFENIVAITGTNGKSSTANICSQIWNLSKTNSATIGTLGVIAKNIKIPTKLTTPDATHLINIFKELEQKKVQNIAMEASSHGLDQHRLDCIKFSICAFTNFTQDHLDYHETFEKYWQAKERLFSELADLNTIFVVNADDPKSEKIFEIAKRRNINYIDYGKKARDIKLISSQRIENYQRVRVSYFKKEIEFDLPLAGSFQVYNALCAAGICNITGLRLKTIFEYFSKLKPISGRLELVGTNVYVDYAHTPDALKKALVSLRKYTTGKLHLVFGCGGERDQKKRKIMGIIASRLADEVIVTDDNPRMEDPTEIRKMILDGCPNAEEIPDRATAIQTAISKLEPSDILLVAGKGHEDYQIFADETIYFSDQEVIRQALGLKK